MASARPMRYTVQLSEERYDPAVAPATVLVEYETANLHGAKVACVAWCRAGHPENDERCAFIMNEVGAMWDYHYTDSNRRKLEVTRG